MLTRKPRNRMDRPSGVDLLKMSGDGLHYEITMLRGAARLLALAEEENKKTTGETEEHWHNRCALIESCAIHARNLYDFFFARDTVDLDDVIAEDFMPAGVDWRTIRPAPLAASVLGGTLTTKANKQIAHLTYHRLQVTPAEKEWDFGKIWAEFMPIVRAWLAHIDPAKVHPKTRALGAPVANVLLGGAFSNTVSSSTGSDAVFVAHLPMLGPGPGRGASG